MKGRNRVCAVEYLSIGEEEDITADCVEDVSVLLAQGGYERLLIFISFAITEVYCARHSLLRIVLLKKYHRNLHDLVKHVTRPCFP